MTSKLANPMANNVLRILLTPHVLSLISSGVLTDDILLEDSSEVLSWLPK